jgi:hypothetical protein
MSAPASYRHTGVLARTGQSVLLATGRRRSRIRAQAVLERLVTYLLRESRAVTPFLRGATLSICSFIVPNVQESCRPNINPRAGQLFYFVN